MDALTFGIAVSGAVLAIYGAVTSTIALVQTARQTPLPAWVVESSLLTEKPDGWKWELLIANRGGAPATDVRVYRAHRGPWEFEHHTGALEPDESLRLSLLVPHRDVARLRNPLRSKHETAFRLEWRQPPRYRRKHRLIDSPIPPE